MQGFKQQFKQLIFPTINISILKTMATGDILYLNSSDLFFFIYLLDIFGEQ